jgi:hypothetical protein
MWTSSRPESGELRDSASLSTEKIRNQRRMHTTATIHHRSQVLSIKNNMMSPSTSYQISPLNSTKLAFQPIWTAVYYIVDGNNRHRALLNAELFPAAQKRRGADSFL